MANKEIKVGVVEKEDLLLFFDYLKGDAGGNQYALEVTNQRGKVYSARMIHEDGEDWDILKLLFQNRYKRIKKDSIRSFEVRRFSD